MKILIDNLRNLGTTPRILAIGAVELPINETQAYHFYSKETPQTIDDIHNHRNSFTSLVVSGGIRNYLYDVKESDKSTLQLVRGACSGVCHASKKLCCKVDVELENVHVTEVCKFDTLTDSSYRLEYNLFHKVEKLTPTIITLITREERAQDTVQFVIDLDDPTECELRGFNDTDKCWEIIQDALANR